MMRVGEIKICFSCSLTESLWLEDLKTRHDVALETRWLIAKSAPIYFPV
jgi:hypothetical protein